MSLVGFRASNHPQQVGRNGADDEIDDRGTPQDFWDELNAQYRFTLDVAAAPHNAKTPNYYTRLADGLLQPWHGSVWCNPPYSGLDRWLEKAWREWQRPDGPHSIVMLLPNNRMEQVWWQTWVEPFRDGRGTVPGEVYVPLSNSPSRLLIDEADWPAVSAHTWRLGDHGYVVTSLPRVDGKNRNMLLHRFLMGLEVGDRRQCDHANRNRLDNRRANLRVSTNAQNGRNRGVYSSNTSGYKGVSFDKRSERWEASIKVDYRKQHLGMFSTAEAASRAYDAAATALHGEYASPNSESGAPKPGSPLSVTFLPGRLRFIKPGATEVKPNERPPFGCCLLVWSR